MIMSEIGGVRKCVDRLGGGIISGQSIGGIIYTDNARNRPRSFPPVVTTVISQLEKFLRMPEINITPVPVPVPCSQCDQFLSCTMVAFRG